MRPDQPSRTAEFNAAFRAAESAKPPSRRLFHDPYAVRLLPAGLRLLARSSAIPIVGHGLTWFVDRRWPGVRTSIIARTRLIDDWVQDAARSGAEQLVLLGAGLDSRAWRLPSLANLRIFEVDHPEHVVRKAAPAESAARGSRTRSLCPGRFRSRADGRSPA